MIIMFGVTFSRSLQHCDLSSSENSSAATALAAVSSSGSLIFLMVGFFKGQFHLEPVSSSPGTLAPAKKRKSRM